MSSSVLIRLWHKPELLSNPFPEFFWGDKMRQTITERICNLILKYCHNDISKVQHIKCFCDKILKDKETQSDWEISNG